MRYTVGGWVGGWIELGKTIGRGGRREAKKAPARLKIAVQRKTHPRFGDNSLQY